MTKKAKTPEKTKAHSHGGVSGPSQKTKRRVGIAVQGGVTAAGSFAAGAIKGLVDGKTFETYDVVVFSGTSSGALIASLCWGYLMEGRIHDAPAALRKLWLDIGYGTVPDAAWAAQLVIADEFARLNPVYDTVAQQIRVPIVRSMMQDWVRRNLDFEKWPKAFAQIKSENREPPGLLLGATDILEGEIKVFRIPELEDSGAEKFRLDIVLASGSLDETNGLTVIKEGPEEGIYLDGAWAINPPISDMIDFGVDEIWLIQVFPQQRASIPATPAERKDRKEELWQNSLIGHQRKMIEFVNKWLSALNDGISKNHKEHQGFRLIEFHVIPMERDLTWSAKIVNAPSFIEGMIDYGYHQAHHFIEKKRPQKATLLSGAPHSAID
jgi:predicted acylesterase/phospholipase RssA